MIRMSGWQRTSQYHLRGFSLLEILITLVILSIGLLGIAGLQLSGLRYAHNANLRYQAALQANDMADRMRANRAGVAAGSYNNISGTPANPGCIQSNCSSSQVAQTDAYEWNTANAAKLPGGSGTVTGNGLNSIFTITVRWNEMGAADVGAEAHSFALSFQP